MSKIEISPSLEIRERPVPYLLLGAVILMFIYVYASILENQQQKESKEQIDDILLKTWGDTLQKERCSKGITSNVVSIHPYDNGENGWRKTDAHLNEFNYSIYETLRFLVDNQSNAISPLRVFVRGITEYNLKCDESYLFIPQNITGRFLVKDITIQNISYLGAWLIDEKNGRVMFRTDLSGMSGITVYVEYIGY